MTADLSKYAKRARPGQIRLQGRDVYVAPVDWEQHRDGLFDAVGGEDNAGLWDYFSFGPFFNAQDMEAVFRYIAQDRNWQICVICDADTDKVLGSASYMRLRQEHGSVEVGSVLFGYALQKTRAATEAMYLMARHVFEDLGYRRYEWKCHNHNAASKKAALRLGFEFEGIFRNDIISKGQNRDTAWFAMIDKDWPDNKVVLETWLSADNFDPDHQQRRKLSDMRASAP